MNPSRRESLISGKDLLEKKEGDRVGATTAEAACRHHKNVSAAYTLVLSDAQAVANTLLFRLSKI
jgi:hypothetical protein